MLVELTIVPVGGDTHQSAEISEAIKIVETSGLSYQITPSATLIEGDWDDVMKVVKQCHERVREASPHVFTLIKIEDEEGETDKLAQNVASIESRIGHAVTRVHY